MSSLTLSSPSAASSSTIPSPFHQAPRPFSENYQQDVLQRQDHFESSARTYPRKLPLVLTKGKGVWVTDANGKEYIDCLCGAGSLPLGHHHPKLTAAIRRLLDEEIPLHTLDLMTPIKDEFLTELLASLPAHWRHEVRVQFCGPTGADGIEAAIKLAKIATGRRSVIAFQGAYHGMTHGTLSLTGQLQAKSAVSNLMSEVHFFPYPYLYRCPFGLGGDAGVKASEFYFERVLKDKESGIPLPAAVILEVVQGEGGVIPAHHRWLQTIRRVTRELKIPLIIDEVQTGIGRTGSLYAFEQAGITPDILVSSKALGGGLPISVMIYDRRWDQWQPGMHAGTFRGNQMAFAQGIEVLRMVREESFLSEVKRKGLLLKDLLSVLQQRFPQMGEIRGEGLMLGVEIVNPNEQPDHLHSYPAYPAFAKKLQQECLNHGLIVELGGREGHVVRFLSPLIITEEEIRLVSTKFQMSLEKTERAFL